MNTQQSKKQSIFITTAVALGLIIAAIVGWSGSMDAGELSSPTINTSLDGLAGPVEDIGGDG